MKRITVFISDRLLPATDVYDLLKSNGVDAKIVTKHAVQVHPDHYQKAVDLSQKQKT